MNQASNPAALQGWVKSIDPNSGRVFFANHITRKTQWEAPDGWVEDPSPPLMPPTQGEDQDEPLPDNWEVMHDPSTGKAFYVDHARQITQWTRPKPQKKPEKAISYAPASTSDNSAALARILKATSSGNDQQHRSYSQEAAYFHHPHTGTTEVDFSDSLPSLDFSVKKVADKYRLECPHCNVLFTISKRRHHCRLCGDVFCDSCSNHRATLPLQGPEFEKPVRICDFCNKDVEQGNFFSMRRYLTPLQLFDPDLNDDDDDNGVATSSNVNAALAALADDLNQIVQSSEGFEEKVTIPPSILVPCISKHLNAKSNTADRAVRALASLLSMGSMVGKNDFAHATYIHGKRQTLDRILSILERSGSDRKTLFVQEQAAQTVFYLSDPGVILSLAQKNNNELDEESGSVESLDLSRAFRNVLDHAGSSKNPNLQRWSAATVRNLIVEDQRRACMAINTAAAQAASGESASLDYESFLDQFVSSGGIMILCSLIGADDSDTRAHATGALGAILTSTRAIDEAMAALSEMTGGSLGRTNKKDGDIVRAITGSGGCGSSVSQLLLSADNSVAGMGCDFIASLVEPLLNNPGGCAMLPPLYDYRSDQDGLGACREAALEIASGSCLPALMSLVRENGRTTRPMELRKRGMECLAASVLAAGCVGKAWSGGAYEEGMDTNQAPLLVTKAITTLNSEDVAGLALEILNSTALQSLGSVRDTPSARILESAGIILGSLTSCSAETIMDLHSRGVLSSLIKGSNDSSMIAASTVRGDAAPRCIGMLEASSAILLFAWQHPSGAGSELLDRLIEVLDAGVVGNLMRILSSKMDWESRDRSSGGMKARAAACRIICCLFGIAQADATAIGMARLIEACDAEQTRVRNGKGPRNIMEAVLTVLQTALSYCHKTVIGGASRGPHYQSALLDLVDACLLAAGSMCGSSVAPGGGDEIGGDAFLAQPTEKFGGTFESRRREVCKVSCDIVIRGSRSGPSLLPTLLVGGFGEESVMSSLRLALAIAQNGGSEEHSKLASSGIIVPVSDLLRTALSKGDLYKFSAALALVRFCGPHVVSNRNGGTESVRDAIRVATNVLALPTNPDANARQMKVQEALKAECMNAIESLSKNSSLWNSISTDALPAITSFLLQFEQAKGEDGRYSAQGAALRAVLQIVQVPSHAVAAARAGLWKPLAKILKGAVSSAALPQNCDFDVAMLAFKVLHIIVTNREARRECNLNDGGLLRSVCFVLGWASDLLSDCGKTIACLGLEILHVALADVEALSDGAKVLQSAGAISFLDALASEPAFVRRLCATLLSGEIPESNKPDAMIGVEIGEVSALYGAPLPLVRSECLGYSCTHDAAIALLFSVSAFACAIESQRSESFWKSAFLADDQPDETSAENTKGAVAFATVFLSYLGTEPNAISQIATNKQDYEGLTRPLVRYRLLEALKELLAGGVSETVVGHQEFDENMHALIIRYNLPRICLSVCKDPGLLELAHQVLKLMVDIDQEDFLPLFVKDKESIVSLLSLLRVETGAGDMSAEIRRFLVSTLERLAGEGLLTEAVERFNVRSEAVSALAFACLSEDVESPSDDAELSSSKLAHGLMQCLVDLCSSADRKGSLGSIELSETEAESIARNLGKKMCQMVISRFLERARFQQYDIEEHENVMDAPEIRMLCAMAQHENALRVLQSVGGLHALAQVASEGDLSALQALSKGFNNDPHALIEADAHSSVIHLFERNENIALWKADKERSAKVEAAAFGLLSSLAGKSANCRRAIAQVSGYEMCHARAVEILSELCLSENVQGKHDTSENDGDFEGDDSLPEQAHGAGIPVGEAPSAVGLTLSEMNEDELDRLEAALGYIAAMISVPGVYSAIFGSMTTFKIFSLLTGEDSKPRLQLESVRILSKVAPQAGPQDGKADSRRIGPLLLSAIARESPGKNLLLIEAVSGIQFVFDDLVPDDQTAVVRAIAALLAKLLKSHALLRSSKSSPELSQGGVLAYQLTRLLLLSSGRESVQECFDTATLLTLTSMIQWRYDPKTEIAADQVCYWDASVAQGLQILSLRSTKCKHMLENASIRFVDLKKNVYMIARPGRAPRKAIDLPSALGLAIKTGDPVSKLAAESFLQHLSTA